MTENNVRKLSISLLPKDKIEGKDFLNYIYYDKDGYIVSSNNYVLSYYINSFFHDKLLFVLLYHKNKKSTYL